MTTLDVAELSVELSVSGRRIPVVEDVSFQLEGGQTHGLVGESGSGKTVTALSIIGLLGPQLGVAHGAVHLGDDRIVSPGSVFPRNVRGSRIGMIFQDPMTALDPCFPVGNQIVEVVRRHQRIGRTAAWKRAIELLDEVGIAKAATRAHDHPHEFSGGMRQRILIAMAIAANPELLIADEPTTGLDVTVQSQVLGVLKRIQEAHGMSTLFITHDFGVASEVCDTLSVMYAGQTVEQSTTLEMFRRPRHPYTQALFDCIPRGHPDHPAAPIPGSVPLLGEWGIGCRFADRCAHRQPACEEQPIEFGAGVRCRRASEIDLPGLDHRDHGPLVHVDRGDPDEDRTPALELRGVTMTYHSGPRVRTRHDLEPAVNDVTLTVRRGETMGLVGESGSGKSTLGRLVVGLLNPDEGSITVGGHPVSRRGRRDRRRLALDVQIVFQDPYSSLDPTWTIQQSIAEPLRACTTLSSDERTSETGRLLELVGLSAELRHRYPRELSGGQRQRIAIARAIALKPTLVVCDEPVASLDVSTQATVLDVFRRLQTETDTAYLFISHDLGVVMELCDRVAVMKGGRIVEDGPAAEVAGQPAHDYTRQLLDARPKFGTTTAAEASGGSVTESSAT